MHKNEIKISIGCKWSACEIFWYLYSSMLVFMTLLILIASFKNVTNFINFDDAFEIN